MIKRTVFAFGILVALSCATLHADIVTQNFTIPQSSGTISSGPFQPFSTFFSTPVNPFDTTLGNLDSVNFSISLDGEVDGTSGSNAVNGFNYSVDAINFASGNFFGSGGSGGGAGGAPGTTLTSSFNLPLSGTLPNGALVDAALSGGTYTWDLSGSFLGGNEYRVTGGTASITYNFTASTVPEPSSASLILTGLVLAGIKRRRK